MEKKTLLTDEQIEVLERLATLIIPKDDFDDGLSDMGFAGTIETRNEYQPWMAELYAIGLQGIENISNQMLGKRFLDLDDTQCGEVIKALKSDNPPGDVWTKKNSALAFYSNIRQDACFIYCTDEDVWNRIGFPGSAFEKGGYPDFTDPQK